jgi:Na+-translocating ferredoxin:NAD+ oxidoreductase RnfE subunit
VSCVTDVVEMELEALSYSLICELCLFFFLWFRITNTVNFKHINESAQKNAVYFNAMGAIHFSLQSTLVSSCHL